MWLVVLVRLIILEILMWSVNLNVKSTMIVLILRPVCPRNAGILVQVRANIRFFRVAISSSHMEFKSAF